MEERFDLDGPALQSAKVSINKCVQLTVQIQPSFTVSLLSRGNQAPSLAQTASNLLIAHFLIEQRFTYGGISQQLMHFLMTHLLDVA